MDFTVPSVDDLAESQQGSYTSVTSVATIVDDKCSDDENVRSRDKIVDDGAIEVGDLFLPEKQAMFQRLNGKIGRMYQASDPHPKEATHHHTIRIFDYNCIPQLEDESELPLKATEIDYNVDLNSESHHTDMFEMTKVRQDSDPLPRLVLRRGLPFFLKFTFDGKFSPDTDELLLTFRFGQAASVSRGSMITVSANKGIKPHNWSAGFSKVEDTFVTVKVLTPNDSIIGKCSLSVDTRKLDPNEEEKQCQSIGDHAEAAKHTTVLRYLHNEPIYILFNPWLKDDQVYVQDDKVREDYIVSDFGQLLVGNYKQIIAIPWRFAQFERNVLDCCLHMLDGARLEHTARGNATVVVRNIASLINACEDSGVMLANWSGHYGDEGTAPTAWLGSLAILEEFWKTKRPVGYGQCWVFAALATTICRCLGIPARCVTNYSSAHDCDGTNTINYHWSIDGEPLESMNSDSIWSFHIWNEAYLTRLDLPGSVAGWQAFDPTPQIASDGIYCAGPCPVEAIRHGDVHLRFDAVLLFSELNVNRFHWVLNSDGSWRTVLQKNIAGKAVVAHSPPDESAPEDSSGYIDLTDQYKCVEGTKEEMAALLRAKTWATNAAVFDKGEGDLRVTLNQNNEVVAGASFDVHVQMQNRSRFDRNAKVTLTLLSTYYTGHRKYRVKSQTFDLVVCPLKTEQVSMRVLGEDYAYYMSDCATFKICTMVRVVETEQLFVDCTDFCVLCPKLEIEIPELIQVGRSFDCTIKLNSQMPIDLTDCEWMIECLGVAPATKIVEKDLEPYAQVELNFSMNPHRLGRTVFMVSFKSKQLMAVYGAQEIDVTH